MTSEAQRILIAEACGWRKAKPDIFTEPLYLNGEQESFFATLPDYLSDLNAMRSAEATLGLPSETNDGPCEDYAETLCRVCGYNPHERALFAWPLLHATAAQRAEAYLKTIGKWTD